MTGIKTVGQTQIKKTHKVTCHCGSVEIMVTLPNGLVDVRRCDCSMCDKRGAIAVSVPLADLELVKDDTLTLYQFNSMTAKHYFCSKCGIYTHHQRRSNPHQYGLNVATLEGINTRDLLLDKVQIRYADGRNHIKDNV